MRKKKVMALILGMMLLFSSGISTAVMAQDNGSDEIPIVENSTDTVVEEETKKQETSVIEGYREVSDSTEDTSGSTDISENKTKARTSAPLTNEPVAKTAKSLTVASDGGDYATIQSAIDYISQQDDKENWTINVKGGEYERFTVLNGLNHLTIQVVSGERAKIETLNDSQAPASTSGAYPDTGGISVRKANHVTIKGFDITMGNNIDKWFFSAISNHSDDNSKGNDLSVSECIFRGNGSSTGVFIDAGSTEWKVNNCTFENIYEAISMYGDGTLLQDARIDSNKFENCSFALHGYYGGTGNSGVLKFTNNTVYGTDTLRCKVVVQDQINTGAIKVDISNNVLDKGIVGLVNLREDGENISDVLKSNKMNAGSFYVEAIEPGSIDFYTSYQAPENDAGYWILNEKNFDSPDFVNYVKELVKKANSQHSRVLNITIDDKQELIKTFTWFKDALYWKSIDAGNLAISKTVTGTHGDKDKDFHFTVTLEDKTVNGTYGDMDFKDGIADITLKHGEKTTATGLPADIKYTVTETEADQDGYVTSSINETGTIPKNDIASVTFTNAKSISGSLIVNKEVTGTHGDKDKDFHFTITLEDKTVNGTYGDMDFKDGIANITLKHGETMTATGLPAGIKYKVTETEADKEDYSTSATNDIGTIPENSSITVTFTNYKEIAPERPMGPEQPTIPEKPETSDKTTITNDAGTSTVDRTGNEDDPETGDRTNMSFYASLSAMSGVCIAILAVWKKKKALRDR